MRLMTVAVLSTAALAALAAVTPASAQAPQRRYVDNTERITVIDQYGRRTTRITVRPRSFLDPGTATKPGSESYHDYAFPPQTYPGEYFGSNQNFRYDWKSSWSRMPFPSCVDLPSYCR
jgi:hypothetical protein